jgi:hypothetical protein
MPLQKLQFRPGINRDATSLATEGGWYACDKVRFRSGFPEKIGGWSRISTNEYLGICRTLNVWRILVGPIYTGAGTHLKMYVENGGAYNDITPIRETQVIATNAFTTTNGSSVVVVTDVAHGAITDTYVIISSSGADVGGILTADFNGEFAITLIDADTYSIDVGVTATSGAIGGNATFNYLLNPGKAIAYFTYGWGFAEFSSYAWGIGYDVALADMRMWTQVTYGENLIFGPKLGGIYQFEPNANPLVFDRGVLVSSLGGANEVPLFQYHMLLEQSARILVVFGTNPFGSIVYDPLHVRWSDVESVVEWEPTATTQAGGYTLSSGSRIVTALHTRQEIVILTDTAVFTMQYVGAPFVFSFAQQSDNISVMGPSCATSINGVVYWMGREKFYMFDGRVQTLECTLLDHVFDDISASQGEQVTAGTNEGFDEVWWHYCSAQSITPDRYVIYNYTLRIWYYGTMGRTAWTDSPLKSSPLAASASEYCLVQHEVGTDDLETNSTLPIEAYIESSDFDIGDGHNMGFVRRILPDLTFTGSTATTPAVTLTLNTKNDPGAALNAATDETVSRTATAPVEQWTKEVYIRSRGRQMNLRIESNTEGTQWKIGTPRLDVRPDGRRA